MLTFTGTADTAKRMAPHWHPPVSTGLVAAVMSAPSAARLPATPPARRRRQRRNRERRRHGARLPARRAALPDRYALLRRLEGPRRPPLPARRRLCRTSTGRPDQRRKP